MVKRKSKVKGMPKAELVAEGLPPKPEFKEGIAKVEPVAKGKRVESLLAEVAPTKVVPKRKGKEPWWLRRLAVPRSELPPRKPRLRITPKTPRLPH